VCTHVQNHFGGVVHRIKGVVYSPSSHSLAGVNVAWTSSDIHACYNGPLITSGSFNAFHYECAYAGNCDATASGSRGTSQDGLPSAVAEGCFKDSVVEDAHISNRHVGPGGEYGDIGLLGLKDSGRQDQVCFLEDTVDSDTPSPLLDVGPGEIMNEDYLLPVSKRFYVTMGTDVNSKLRSEGINRSYVGHDFLIITRGAGASAYKECGSDEVNSLKIAPREITQVLTSGGNVVLSEFDYTSYTSVALPVANTIDGAAASSDRLYIENVGSCYASDSESKYACAVPGGLTSEVTIYKTSGGAFSTCTTTLDAGNCVF